MFVPLYDGTPLRTIRVPFVTYGMMIACTAIYAVFQSGLVVDANLASIGGYAMIPAELIQHIVVRRHLATIPEPLTLVTYMFLHGGWMHLGGNMLFLWVFGDNVEDAMGHGRYLAFYLLTGVAAGLAHTLVSPYSDVPLVGASGAIAGVLAAYLMLHPRVKLWVLLLGRIPLKLSALWVIGGWAVFQLVMLVIAKGHETAWCAHIGGFAAGAALIPLMRRPGVPLFADDLPARTVRPPTAR
jgi:membrane associated rhomboid family serine protease